MKQTNWYAIAKLESNHLNGKRNRIRTLTSTELRVILNSQVCVGFS